MILVRSHVRRITMALAASSALALGACSANDAGGDKLNGQAGGAAGGGGTGGSGGSGANGGSSTDGGGLLDASLNKDGALTEAGACAAESTKAELIPLDMYIMMDQSGSMSETVSGGGSKWTAVTQALSAFVSDPSTGGIGVGIGYFGTKGDSCIASDYAVPEVEIAPLPGVASQITSSLAMHSPSTGTPTAPALAGAINHAKAWAVNNPTHTVVVVLATDGEPLDCKPTDTQQIGATIAAPAANGTPKILTYVIGVGSSLSNLNDIAAAGGTGQALIVDTTQNAKQQFIDAMNKIRGSALACEYVMPTDEGGKVDPTKVNVTYTPGGDAGAPVTLAQVANKAACNTTTGGWYYDDPNNPTKIVVCDVNCAQFKNDTSGEVDILLGCKTKTN